MTFVELLTVLVLGGIVWFWFDSLKAREAGLEAARRACQREGLQVSRSRRWLATALSWRVMSRGHMVLRRGFDFEYSLTGNDRYRGAVVIEGREVVLVDLAEHRARVVSLF